MKTFVKSIKSKIFLIFTLISLTPLFIGFILMGIEHIKKIAIINEAKELQQDIENNITMYDIWNLTDYALYRGNPLYLPEYDFLIYPNNPSSKINDIRLLTMIDEDIIPILTFSNYNDQLKSYIKDLYPIVKDKIDPADSFPELTDKYIAEVELTHYELIDTVLTSCGLFNYFLSNKKSYTDYRTSYSSLIGNRYDFIIQSYLEILTPPSTTLQLPNRINSFLSNLIFYFCKQIIPNNYIEESSYVGLDFYNNSFILESKEATNAYLSNQITTKTRYYYNNFNSPASFHVAIPFAENSVLLCKTNFHSNIHIFLLLILFSLFSLLLSFIIIPFLFFRISHPISKLSNYISSNMKEELNIKTTNIPYINRNDEFGDISRNFKQISSKINKSFDVIKDYANDLSLSYAEPLKELNLNISLLENTHNKDIISSILRNVSDMENLTTKLRYITKITNKSDNQDTETIPIFEMAKNIVSNYNFLNCQLIDETNGGTINIQVEHLEYMFKSLLDNAIIAGDSITLSIKKLKKQFYEIKLQDNGNGIKDKDIIFKNFYSSWNNISQKHMGLGLPLVNAIVQAHNGIISVTDNNETSGSCFTILLPSFSNKNINTHFRI